MAQLDKLATPRMLADFLEGWSNQLRGLSGHGQLQEVLEQSLFVLLHSPSRCLRLAGLLAQPQLSSKNRQVGHWGPADQPKLGIRFLRKAVYLGQLVQPGQHPGCSSCILVQLCYPACVSLTGVHEVNFTGVQPHFAGDRFRWQSGSLPEYRSIQPDTLAHQ